MSRGGRGEFELDNLEDDAILLVDVVEEPDINSEFIEPYKRLDEDYCRLLLEARMIGALTNFAEYGGSAIFDFFVSHPAGGLKSFKAKFKDIFHDAATGMNKERFIGLLLKSVAIATRTRVPELISQLSDKILKSGFPERLVKVNGYSSFIEIADSARTQLDRDCLEIVAVTGPSALEQYIFANPFIEGQSVDESEIDYFLAYFDFIACNYKEINSGKSSSLDALIELRKGYFSRSVAALLAQLEDLNKRSDEMKSSLQEEQFVISSRLELFDFYLKQLIEDVHKLKQR